MFSALTLTLGAGIASAGPLDRLEDRADRIESRIDERYDRGPLDVVEDRVDRIESVLDRNGIERTPRIDRVERRSIRWRFWNTANTE